MPFKQRCRNGKGTAAPKTYFLMHLQLQASYLWLSAATSPSCTSLIIFVSKTFKVPQKNINKQTMS